MTNKSNTIYSFINGKYLESNGITQNIYNPATGEITAQISMGNSDEVNIAVNAAKEALGEWSKLSALKRSRYLFNYVELLYKNKEKLAQLITSQHGKVFDDALGEVQRGIEAVEFACGIPNLLKSEMSFQIANNIDSYSMRKPVGVCTGITPFNFPLMVPLWMFPLAIACGNTFVLKPSEKDPAAAILAVELLHETGIPKGVVNVVHGNKKVVDALLTHEDIAAVSFVGSTPIAKYIYETASKHGKRVQSLGGAKNHCIVMPDADMNDATNGLMGAGFGSAGERCMAISVVVAVGNETADKIVSNLSSKIETLKVAPGDIKGAEMGPVISKEHKEKIINYINSGIEQGASLIKDGRNFICPNYEKGFFLGPTLFDNVKPDMTIYKEEIFGPVLSVIRVGSLKEAISLINKNQHANGTAIYTKDGASARQFSYEIQVGMVGINVPIPVPMSFHSFGGWKNSLFGSNGMHGSEGVHFYTRLQTVTAKWDSSSFTENNQFFMPTLQ